MPSVGDLLDGVKVGLAQLGDEPVALDALRGGALGQDNVAALETPCEQNLRKVVAASLGNFVELGVGANLLAGAGNLVLGAERGVGGDENVVFLAVLDELGVGEEGVDFDLVDHGLDLGDAEQLLQAGDGPVGDSDGLGLARVVNLLHGAPCWLRVLGELLLDDVFAVGSQLGHVVVVALCGNGPVDEERVDVVDAQVLQRRLKTPLDLLGLVQVVPYFCDNEKVLALDVGVFLEEIADGVANFALVLVEPRAVEMAVASLERGHYGGVGLARCAFAGKGAESDGWHDDAIGKLERLLVREGSHICGVCNS